MQLHSLVGYFIFSLVFHPKKKFGLFKYFDGSKVQIAICHRNKRIYNIVFSVLLEYKLLADSTWWDVQSYIIGFSCDLYVFSVYNA